MRKGFLLRLYYLTDQDHHLQMVEIQQNLFGNRTREQTILLHKVINVMVSQEITYNKAKWGFFCCNVGVHNTNERK